MNITQYNNPFNIRPGQGYAGESGTYKGKDGSEYVIFDSMELGLRAGLVDLRSKIKQKDGDLLEMIKKFAPEQDQNDPKSYFSFVSNKIGKDTVSESDLPELAKAFIEFENTPETASSYLAQFDSVYNDVNAMSKIDMPTDTNLSQAKNLAGISDGVPVPQQKPDEPAIAQASMPDLITTPTGSPASSQTEMAQLITEPSDPNITLDIDPTIDDNIINSPNKPISDLTDQPLDLLTEQTRVADAIDNDIDLDVDFLTSRMPIIDLPKVEQMPDMIDEANVKPLSYDGADVQGIIDRKPTYSNNPNYDVLVSQERGASVYAVNEGIKNNTLPNYNLFGDSANLTQNKVYNSDPDLSDIVAEGKLYQVPGGDGQYYSRDDVTNKEYFAFTNDSSQIWSAAFRQENELNSIGRLFEDMNADFVDDPNYDPVQDKRIPDGYHYQFLNSGSYDQTTIMLQRFYQDMEDMETLNMASSGWGFTRVVSGLASPTTLAPLSAPFKALRTGSASQRFIKGGLYGTAVMMPSEMLMSEQIYTRDVQHSVMILATAGLFSAAASQFRKPIASSASSAPQSQKRLTYDDGTIDMRRDGFDVDGDPIFRSVGAAGDDFTNTTAWKTMEQDALRETGVGLEKLGWNPTIRLFKSQSPTSRSVVTSLVDVGGLIQKKVNLGEKMDVDKSVESTFRVKYVVPMYEAITSMYENFLKYRVGNVKDGDIKRIFQGMGVSFKDFGKTMKGSTNPYLSQVEFRIRVGKAMRRGDKDSVQDNATPFIEQSAKAMRNHFNFIKDEATKARLFERELQGFIKSAKLEGNVALVEKLTAQLAKLREQGVTPNTAISYLPRVYRIDKIMAKQQEFLGIAENFAINKLKMNPKQAKKFALSYMDKVTMAKPYYDLEDVAGFEDFVKTASGFKARTVEIDDELIEDFLESDVEVLVRHHTKTMGIDIELVNRFSDVDMRKVTDAITQDYKKLIDNAKTPQAKKDLKKALDDDLRDIKGLRDRVRGTYGVSKDPHAASSRFIRGMKSFNVIVGMGGATVSSIPDIARLIMTEGTMNFYQKGLLQLFKDNQSVFKKMTKSELRKAGVALDAQLGLRSAAMSDISDIFGSRFGWERALNQSAGVSMVINGLNIWNQVLKEMSGQITMFRMTEGIMKPWSKLSVSDKEKFLKSGIGEQEHMRMQALIKKHGLKEDGEWNPNTEKWEDATMRMTFRNALNIAVERTIITPGAADRALWTSTEWGSFATQFKSYGQGATMRMATAGLQEKDGAFWQGAIVLIGLAAAVNEVKRLQYGLEKDESFRQKLINAIDRSGIGGYFTDVNNAVEKLTDYRLGLRPITGSSNPYDVKPASVAAATVGPGIANMITAGSVFGDVITNSMDEKTLRSLRFLMPQTNNPALDPIYDGVFGQ